MDKVQAAAMAYKVIIQLITTFATMPNDSIVAKIIRFRNILERIGR